MDDDGDIRAVFQEGLESNGFEVVPAATVNGALTLISTQDFDVLLSDLHDWPHDRIAEMLDTSPGMSRQHLFKARRRLRELLGADTLKEHFND